MEECISSLIFQPGSGDRKREMIRRVMTYNTSPSREVEEKKMVTAIWRGTKPSNHSHGKTASTLREGMTAEQRARCGASFVVRLRCSTPKDKLSVKPLSMIGRGLPFRPFSSHGAQRRRLSMTAYQQMYGKYLVSHFFLISAGFTEYTSHSICNDNPNIKDSDSTLRNDWLSFLPRSRTIPVIA